jgi:hypothetical protein
MSLYDDFEPQPEHYKERKMSFKIKGIERKPMTSKAGKSYLQLIVLTEDGRRATGFGNKSNESWTIGYTVSETEAVIVANGKYFNIQMVEQPKISQKDKDIVDTASKVIDDHFAMLNRRLEIINKKLDQLLNNNVKEVDNEEDIPF